MNILGYVGKSAISEEERIGILKLIPERGRFLEIGTLHGVTVAWWATNRSGVEFVSIDPFCAGTGTGAGDIGNWFTNHRKNQRLFVGDVKQFGYFQKHDQFDLAFVDGDHSEAATFKDLEWARIMVKGGQPIIVNDYGRKEVNWRLAGVTLAVDSFCEKRGYKFEPIARSTIVLRKKWGDENGLSICNVKKIEGSI